MWAMWANILKNFVRGPSAAVTFGARPYPGALSRKPNATRHTAINLTEPYNVVLWWGAMWAVSTQPARSLAMTMWPCGHDHARTFVDNVDNVDTTFQSLAKRGVVSIREQAWLHNLIVNYIVLHIIYHTLPYIFLPTLSTM